MATQVSPAYMQAHSNESRSSAIYGSNITGLVIIVASTLLRFVARRKRKTGLKVDDWLMLATAVSSSAILSIGIASHAWGHLGWHFWTMTPEDLVEMLKVNVGSTFLFGLAFGLLRASILLMYLRLFTTRGFQIQVWIVSILNVIYTIISICIYLFRCIPIKKQWDIMAPGTCMDIVAIITATASLNVVFDVVVFLLPLPPILRLQMSWSRKIMLCATFLLGTAVCAICAARASMSRIYSAEGDFTWDIVNVTILSWAELYGGILCANAVIGYPILAGFVQTVSSSVRSLTSRTTTTGTSESRKPYGAKRLAGDSDIAMSDASRFGTSFTSQAKPALKDNEDVESLIGMPPHAIRVDRATNWDVSTAGP